MNADSDDSEGRNVKKATGNITHTADCDTEVCLGDVDVKNTDMNVIHSGDKSGDINSPLTRKYQPTKPTTLQQTSSTASSHSNPSMLSHDLIEYLTISSFFGIFEASLAQFDAFRPALGVFYRLLGKQCDIDTTNSEVRELLSLPEQDELQPEPKPTTMGDFFGDENNSENNSENKEKEQKLAQLKFDRKNPLNLFLKSILKQSHIQDRHYFQTFQNFLVTRLQLNTPATEVNIRQAMHNYDQSRTKEGQWLNQYRLFTQRFITETATGVNKVKIGHPAYRGTDVLNFRALDPEGILENNQQRTQFTRDMKQSALYLHGATITKQTLSKTYSRLFGKVDEK
jgi:hypothetical protein